MKSYFKSGELYIWLTGLGLGVSLMMIAGLLLLIVAKGSDYYFPKDLEKISLKDGTEYLGQEVKRENVPQANLPDSLKGRIFERYQYKIANRDIYGFDFVWLDEREIANRQTFPEFAAIVERLEFGNYHGYIKSINKDGKVIYSGKQEVYDNIGDFVNQASSLRNSIKKVEKASIGELNFKIEQLRLKLKKVDYQYAGKPDIIKSETAAIQTKIDSYDAEYHHLRGKADSLMEIGRASSVILVDSKGEETELLLSSVINVYFPNKMNIFGKIGYLFEKVYEFIFDEPRESNTEGGIFPAIFGTVLMVLLMSVAVVPFGALAALYLREYAKQGPFVRMVRIAVNNLAGVPSIVFGIFGLGFFIYFVGGSIDKIFYPELLPNPTWGTGGILWASLTLSLLTVPVVIVATEEALATIPRGIREASLALGATKWQTISRIVLPSATPGILTGLILAMARAAGEVAPLMITGVVKLAPNLPMDGHFPFFHLDRKFMHLGFHIYDVGFQSPNIEAALPMVYMTTLLLIGIVILLNITAMKIRTNLRKKYKASIF